MKAVDPTATEAWARLTELAASYEPDLRATLTPEWVDRQTLVAADLHVDLSKNLLDGDVEAALLALADQVDVTGRRDAMLAGERINVTEDRAVLHTALRLPRDAELTVDGQDVVAGSSPASVVAQSVGSMLLMKRHSRPSCT